MTPLESYRRRRWVLWVVAIVLVGDRCWSQFHMRSEVVQAVRPYCKDALFELSSRWVGGLGDGYWRERSVLACVPGYLFTAKSYTVTVSSTETPHVEESTDFWPYLFLIGAAAYAVYWLRRTIKGPPPSISF